MRASPPSELAFYFRGQRGERFEVGVLGEFGWLVLFWGFFFYNHLRLTHTEVCKLLSGSITFLVIIKTGI